VSKKRVKWKAALVLAFSCFGRPKVFYGLSKGCLSWECVYNTRSNNHDWVEQIKCFIQWSLELFGRRVFGFQKKHLWNKLLRNFKSYIYFLDVWGWKSSSFPSCKTNLVFQTKKRKTILKESFFKHGFPEPILFQKHNS